jgi:hypothetical protein
MEKRSLFYDAVVPIAGFIVCFLIWISLPTPAKVIGGLWFILGLAYLILRTGGLKQKPVILSFKDI